ncbi:MAG: Mu-like prophage major head subunit gpT family protein [Deltaproteobacteria bacterium]|nr:Mu-like prophage major head subunit gpT family protein [Deltaproteobacteria bacterium]
MSYANFGTDDTALTTAMIQGLQIHFETTAKDIMKQSTLKQVATVTNVKQLNLPMRALEFTPTMRRWASERASQVGRTLEKYVKSFKYEITPEIELEAVRQEQWDLVASMMVESAVEAVLYPESELYSMIAASDSVLGMDDTYMCSSSHANSQNNKGSADFSLAELKAGRLAMRKFTRPNGRPFLVNPNVLIIHPDSEDLANEIINSRLLIGYGGGSNTTAPHMNVLYNSINTIISRPELSSGQFFLLDNRGGFKPWLFNQPYGGYKWDKEGNTVSRFERDVYRFGMMYHFGISGTMFWYKWYGSKNGAWPTYTDPETVTG